jgi:hypothetical protein
MAITSALVIRTMRKQPVKLPDPDLFALLESGTEGAREEAARRRLLG